ncbi:hypothetical protein HX021_05800 [Sphingobacterium sp. N143]|uniref:DUF2683 family protein n=1 Tax=Sphingobacterium sp. N143 TaxID=2746727 RepID=UPI002576C492|nr:DUF2683 family protein [Sphingobacterium sp. N143]MDM1293806.1 hypothetical protein [Sphingobacterium sp. N143]
MTTITAEISNKKDVKVLKEILDRFGIKYQINEQSETNTFSAEQMASFEQSQKEFLEGETPAIDWEDLKKKLNDLYA